MLSILFGLLSALSWGASDFTGGLASRRASSLQVVSVPGWQGQSFCPCRLDFKRAAYALAGLALVCRSWQHRCDWHPSPVPIDGRRYHGDCCFAFGGDGSRLTRAGGCSDRGLAGFRDVSGFPACIVGVWLISQTQAGGKTTRLSLAELKRPLISVCVLDFTLS